LAVLQAAAAKQVGSELSGLTKSKTIRQKLETAKMDQHLKYKVLGVQHTLKLHNVYLV
jgi:hypothetical protein